MLDFSLVFLLLKLSPFLLPFLLFLLSLLSPLPLHNSVPVVFRPAYWVWPRLLGKPCRHRQCVCPSHSSASLSFCFPASGKLSFTPLWNLSFMKAGSSLLVWLLFINVSSLVTGNELDKEGGREEGTREGTDKWMLIHWLLARLGNVGSVPRNGMWEPSKSCSRSRRVHTLFPLILNQAPDGHIAQVQLLNTTLSMSVFTVRRDLYRGKGWEGPKSPADIALGRCLPNTVDRPPARHILPFNQNINTHCSHVCAHTNISLHITTCIFCSFLFDFIQSFKTILVLTYYVGFMTC